MTLAVPDIATVAAVLAPDASTAQPARSVNFIRIKPGRFEEFIALQSAHLERIRGTVPGVVGTRMFIAPERSAVILVSAFETAEHAQRFRQDPRFVEHLGRAGSLIESTEAMPVELAYEIGVI
jgi:antibiotic biosynthesis monooxygenase (ABM) superfamily enzyme